MKKKHTHLTYGVVQKQAIAAGLIMSRCNKTGQFRLRYRDPTVSRKEWFPNSFSELVNKIRELEVKP